MNVELFQVLTPLKQEPSSGLSSPMTLSAADLTSSGRKRSDIDFESFSDPKRRKTEKGGKGLRHFSMKVSRAHHFSSYPISMNFVEKLGPVFQKVILIGIGQSHEET